VELIQDKIKVLVSRHWFSNIPENFNEKLQPPLVNLSNVMLKKMDEQLITNELRKTHLDRACNLQLESDMYPNSTRRRFSTASAA